MRILIGALALLTVTLVSAALVTTNRAASPAPDASGEPVRFIVYGDTQDETAGGRAVERALVALINQRSPHFVVHIGDIKGSGVCSDALYDEVRQIFDRVIPPLVYTPGDNEWTDCFHESYGTMDPLERLEALRTRFFSPGQSLGQNPMPLESQSLVDPTHGLFVENARWKASGVHFATLHVVGSNNNLRADAAAFAEFDARDTAVRAWLQALFDQAEADQALGVVLFFHANPQWDQPWWDPSGFDAFRQTLLERTTRFARPVLVVHGDTHNFRIDKPVHTDGDLIETLTRLEVFGPPDVGAIEVTVDPSTPGLFTFSALHPERPDGN